MDIDLEILSRINLLPISYKGCIEPRGVYLLTPYDLCMIYKAGEKITEELYHERMDNNVGENFPLRTV